MFFIKPFSFHSRSLGNLSSAVKFICLSLLLVAVAVPCTIAQSFPQPPQGTQADAAFDDSFKSNHVINVFATTQKTSCYAGSSLRRRFEPGKRLHQGDAVQRSREYWRKPWAIPHAKCHQSTATGKQPQRVRYSRRPHEPQSSDRADQMVR